MDWHFFLARKKHCNRNVAFVSSVDETLYGYGWVVNTMNV